MRLKEVEKGARVECIAGYDGNSKIKDQRGTLVDVEQSLSRPGVRFDKYIGGHELQGTRTKLGCARGHGWYIPIAKLRLITPAKSKKS